MRDNQSCLVSKVSIRLWCTTERKGSFPIKQVSYMIIYQCPFVYLLHAACDYKQDLCTCSLRDEFVCVVG